MARRLIGLDIGTNAVTVAEVRAGEPPRLDMFGQVALGRETMREGEVADDAAVTEAVGRLREEVGLKKAAVRLGLASPRVVVRQIEMPLMSREELSSALQFQAAELIPIPLDDAVLDFAILGPANPGDNGEPRMHVLLAAVQEATVLRLVAAVEAGGLQVAAVDLVPLALIRSLARPARELALVGAGAVVSPNGSGVEAGDGVATADSGVGAEGIVSFGGGVTAIAVHEIGVPRFVRVLGTGGRELTDAIASELDLPPETAEALKRQLGEDAHESRHEELVARARTSIERPLSVLLDEVRSSIDYYRNQPGSSPLLRIVATGGAAQLPGLTERLSALVGVPVEHARPRELVALGDIGFADDELPRLDPYLPAAVGLALGGAGVGTVIDLLPRTRRNAASRPKPQISPKVIAAGAAFVVALGGVTFMANQSVSHAKSQRAAVQAEITHVQAELGALQPILDREQQIQALQDNLHTLLAADVAWQTMMERITANIPPGVTLTSFNGQETPPVPVAAPAPPAATGTDSSSAASGSSSEATTTTQPAPPPTPTISGAITFQGTAKDYPTLANWIDAMGKVPQIANVYVTSATKVATGTDGAASNGLTFTATAEVAADAQSKRLDEYAKAGK
jgi:type IV pilus assembly protein PilM